MDCINIEFYGNQPNTAFINMWQAGEQWNYQPVQLNFDTSVVRFVILVKFEMYFNVLF